MHTGVLATQLGVHLVHGRGSSLSWVTTLDRARSAAEAEARITVHDGRGKVAESTPNALAR